MDQDDDPDLPSSPELDIENDDHNDMDGNGTEYGEGYDSGPFNNSYYDEDFDSPEVDNGNTPYMPTSDDTTHVNTKDNIYPENSDKPNIDHNPDTQTNKEEAENPPTHRYNLRQRRERQKSDDFVYCDSD